MRGDPRDTVVYQDRNETTNWCEYCPYGREATSPKHRLAKLLHKACEELENQLKEGKLALKLQDYLKLLEFQRDFETESEQAGPKEVKVVWVDRDPRSSE